MLDNSNLKEPFDITSIEEEVSSLVGSRSPYAPSAALRRLHATTDRRDFESRVEDSAEVVEDAGAEDATEALLSTREATHGDFGDNARISQAIKRICRAEPGWELLTDTEREAMDMIALKFSRLLSGKALELQHWEDIVGYAKLAEKLCMVIK